MDKLYTLNQESRTIASVALRASDDAWAIAYDTKLWSVYDVPGELTAELTRLTAINATISTIVLGPNASWLVVYNGNQFTAINIPQTLYDRLSSLQTAGASITARTDRRGYWATRTRIRGS